MYRLAAVLALVLCSCGGDDTLSPVPGGVDYEVYTGTVTVTVVEDGEVIIAEEVEPEPEPVENEIVQMDEYPEGYCESEMWVLDCAPNVAVLAIGPGCEKYLEVVLGPESKQYCG